jgi:hypothetical protein
MLEVGKVYSYMGFLFLVVRHDGPEYTVVWLDRSVRADVASVWETSAVEAGAKEFVV